jgi:hypothetical protein
MPAFFGIDQFRQPLQFGLGYRRVNLAIRVGSILLPKGVISTISYPLVPLLIEIVEGIEKGMVYHEKFKK